MIQYGYRQKGAVADMKRLNIPDAEMVIMALQDEIRRSSEARYDHRLHSVLLVAQGMNCREASEILGDAPRTVEYWINRFLEDGLSGLADADHPGRPSRLTASQIKQIGDALRSEPRAAGLDGNVWDGKTLSEYIAKTYQVDLSVRQCQRLFRQLRFRLRKPGSQMVCADSEL